MTIEAFIIQKLSEAEALAWIPVSGSVLHPVHDKCVTVEKTGSGRTNRINSATIAVQSWAGTRAEAAALNDTVKALMDGLIAEDEISDSTLNSDYNYPDLSTNHPRYQAVYEIVYLMEEQNA